MRTKVGLFVVHWTTWTIVFAAVGYFVSGKVRATPTPRFCPGSSNTNCGCVPDSTFGCSSSSLYKSCIIQDGTCDPGGSSATCTGTWNTMRDCTGNDTGVTCNLAIGQCSRS
jgi:hypothetical protein